MTAAPSAWLEAISAPTRLLMCVDHLERLGAEPGVAGATLASMRTPEALEELSATIVEGRWRPKAAVRVSLAEQPDRRIAVPSLRDRVVLRATAQVLAEQLDATLGEHAWAYRPGRSVDDALDVLSAGVRQGRLHYVRTDVESFFDTIDRTLLQNELRSLGVPEDVLALIQRAITGQVLDGGALVVDERGVLQGSPLSPFLSNIALRALDREVTTRLPELTYVRYADDITLLASDREQVASALEMVRAALAAVNLRLNPGKTRAGHVSQGLAVLGTTITVDGRIEGSRLRDAIAARAAACSSGPELQALADVLDAMRPHWLRWPLTTVPLLATAALSSGEVPADGDLARARLALSDEPTASWDVHVVLLQRWAGGSGTTVDLALVVELRALLRHTSCDTARLQQLSGVVDLPLDLLGAVLARDGDSAVQLVGAGHRRIGRALQALNESLRPGGAAPSEGVAVQLHRLFTGRVDMHHREVEVRHGTRNWRRLNGPLELEAVREHVRGGLRAGISPVRTEGTATVCGIRVDVVRTAFPAAWMLGAYDDNGREARAKLADLFGVASEWARTLLVVAQSQGWEPLIEQHGRGFAFWFLMKEPVQAMTLRAAMRDLINRAPAIPAVLAVQVRPNEDAAGPRGGTHMVMPLGGAGGIAAAPPALRDARFRVVEDVEAHLMAVRHHERELLLGTSVAAGAPLKRPPVWDSMGAVAEVAAGAQGRRLLEGCAVLRSLVGQALVTGMLDSTERRTVLETAGHLPGARGDSLVRRVMRQVGYSAAAADRQVARLSPHPLGCARIRERHPDTAVRVGCACVFARHPNEAYDTPLLHVYTAQDLIRLIRRSQQHGVGGATPGRGPGGGGQGAQGSGTGGGARVGGSSSGGAGVARPGGAGAAARSGVGGTAARSGAGGTGAAVGTAVSTAVVEAKGGEAAVVPADAPTAGVPEAAGGDAVGVVERVMSRVAALMRGGGSAGGGTAGAGPVEGGSAAGGLAGERGGGPAAGGPAGKRSGGPAAGEPRPPDAAVVVPSVVGSSSVSLPAGVAGAVASAVVGCSGADRGAESLGEVFAGLAESRARLRVEEERVRELEAELERAFAAAGVDRLPLAAGALHRVDSGGVVRYLWEP